MNPNPVIVGEFSYINDYNDYKNISQKNINDYKNLYDYKNSAWLNDYSHEEEDEPPMRSRMSPVPFPGTPIRDTQIISAPVPPAPSKPKKSTVHFTTTCSVCLEDFGDGKISSTECGHLFHSGCLETALETKKECPNCRAAVE